LIEFSSAARCSMMTEGGWGPAAAIIRASALREDWYTFWRTAGSDAFCRAKACLMRPSKSANSTTPMRLVWALLSFSLHIAIAGRVVAGPSFGLALWNSCL
jgi:hypothetical protein